MVGSEALSHRALPGKNARKKNKNIMKTIQEIKEEIQLLPADKAIEILSSYLAENPRDTDLLTLRGMKYFGAGQRAAAINDYLAALEIDPECKAKLALKSANEILDYYNKDLFNP